MYKVYEVFSDGKRYKLFETNDRFTAEVWMENHRYCTRALYVGTSTLVLEESE